MKEPLNKIFLRFCSIVCTFLFIFCIFNSPTFAYSEKQSQKLAERISNDFTKKFCNGIAFGLSKESAMNFANKENNIIFEKKNGIEDLNKKNLANKIAVSVVETCGYRIKLIGEEGINQFENDYLSLKTALLN